MTTRTIVIRTKEEGEPFTQLQLSAYSDDTANLVFTSAGSPPFHMFLTPTKLHSLRNFLNFCDEAL